LITYLPYNLYSEHCLTEVQAVTSTNLQKQLVAISDGEPIGTGVR